jgi:5-deoxy-glucuronate isomerase
MTRLFYPSGTAGDGTLDLIVDPPQAGWDYSGLRVVSLDSGAATTVATGQDEMAVLPLSGGCTVEVEHHRFDLTGRSGVFEGVTDFAYVPIDTEVRLTADSGPAQIALCTARATRRIDPYRVAAADVGVEIRGGGFGTRQINNFLSADVHDADKLIAVEVLTPEGNWSSYPPHKHDEFSEHEVALEEIYYFRIHGDKGVGFFNMYSTDGEIALTEVVRDGDLVLVPRGFHGPAAAAPEHHMYYLNVMAGPAEQRVWRFCDDPDHAWIRGRLEEYPPDPRLPLTRAT